MFLAFYYKFCFISMVISVPSVSINLFLHPRQSFQVMHHINKKYTLPKQRFYVVTVSVFFERYKVKMSLCLIKHHALKYILDLGAQWPATCPSQFITWKRKPVIQWVWGWMGSEINLGVVTREKSMPLLGTKCWSSSS
jgi:hypothetical protein